MDSETTLKSEKSHEYVLRGFRHQTLYTLYRIINDSLIHTFCPENKEDLSILHQNKLKEIIQVKSYTSDLKISSLKPKKEDSFFNRSLVELKKDPTVSIKLISFGSLGPELEKWVSGTDEEKNKIIKKMNEKYGYEINEAELLIEKITIEKVSEREILKNLFDYIADYQIGDPQLTFEILIQWIFQISEKTKTIDTESFINKLNNIGLYISEKASYQIEFGSSIIPLEEIEIEKNKEEDLKKEFEQGISAKYEHVLYGLDVKRYNKLDTLKKLFNKTNLVIIHGASGQGKSTLVYRYLHENYPTSLSYIIDSKGQNPKHMVKVLKSLSKPINQKIALFLDIEPGNDNWNEIIENIGNNDSFDIIVTIREEDWKRSTFQKFKTIYEEMELCLTKKEASDIYENIEDPYFVDFEHAWIKFKENGPLLEFIYLLNHGETLYQRLESQIKRIEEESEKSNDINQVNILKIISIITSYGIKIDLLKLKSKISPLNFKKSIEFFEKEYLIRIENDNQYLKGLHEIRSKIMCEIFFEEILDPKKDYVDICINCISEKDLELFLINYFLEDNEYRELLDKIHNFQIKTWEGYGKVANSLLWLGVSEYVNINKEIITKGYENFDRLWSTLLWGDISGFLEERDFLKMLNDLKQKINPDTPESIDSSLVKSLRKKILDKNLIYKYIKKWFKEANIPNKLPETENDWYNLGFSLFWIGNLNINKKITFPMKQFELYSNDISLDNLTAVILGLYSYEKKIDIIEQCRSFILERVKKNKKIPLVYKEGDKLVFSFIVDIINHENKNERENYTHDITLENLDLMRKLFPECSLYQCKGYGHKIIEMSHDDTIKNIPAENLPIKWITTINSLFLNLSEYRYFRKTTWKEYVEQVIDLRLRNINLLQKITKNIEIYFSKKKRIDIMDRNNLKDEIIKFKDFLPYDILFPKNIMDPFGFTRENIENNFNDDNLENSFNLNSSMINILKTYETYLKAFSDYKYSLENNLRLIFDTIDKKTLIKGKNDLIIKKLDELYKQDLLDDHIQKLSVNNLYETYLNLLNFQEEFKKHFSKYYNELDKLEEKELEIYKYFIILWKKFALEKFELNKNVKKESKEKWDMIEKRLNNKLYNLSINGNMVEYLEKNSKESPNFILHVENVKNTIQYLDEIIDYFRNEYKNITIFDLIYLFLKIKLSNINIISEYKNYVIPNMIFSSEIVTLLFVEKKYPPQHLPINESFFNEHELFNMKNMLEINFIETERVHLAEISFYILHINEIKKMNNSNREIIDNYITKIIEKCLNILQKTKNLIIYLEKLFEENNVIQNQITNLKDILNISMSEIKNINNLNNDDLTKFASIIMQSSIILLNISLESYELLLK
ncbi:MAG: hypothetical protein ISP01_04325 [Methanobrevibacter arboriphilus]|uniref:Uncharacterized protein n=1 Tax=Methanobrevibacter arboriphilus TaxID=39441 RepID=A0A843AMR9_METAZ|nr:hypothetical protein [Methanobrevibacter arboriphilus]MBF4468609.1 hypothetical protein [Methanobrevibacter arboriphilus]